MKIPEATFAKRLTLLSACLFAIPSSYSAAQFGTLYRFGGYPDGANPYAGVVIGNGVLYGTTYAGGSQAYGTVFSLVPPTSSGGSWTEVILHSFADFNGTDGANPQSTVAIGGGGVLYGTTFYGGGLPTCGLGCGTVFSLTPPTAGGAWTESSIHLFGAPLDGGAVAAPVVIGKDGVLYGTAPVGGISGWGLVFALVPPASAGGSWTEKILYNFQGGTDGFSPGPVAIGDNGVLYGLTYGGSSNNGTAFSLAPPASAGGSWTKTVLYSFGGTPDASPGLGMGLAIARDGVLYGAATGGGAAGFGAVFALRPPSDANGAWSEQVLYSFSGGNDGAQPYAGVTIGTRGTLYGTTRFGGPANYGTVYSLTPPASRSGSWSETVLHSFTGAADGGFPAGVLAIDNHSRLYGTTEGTGVGTAANGTVFAVMP
jgi:uncharacterized repeat protein (TIGR03803 family)